jgi:LSD1 subclass zinc finger protein
VIVRCGSCRTEFDVPGPGRFSCPVCGSVNMVRAAGGAAPGNAGGGLATPPAPPPPRPEPPSPKLACPECGFSFIVGQIEVATCPNCAAEVPTGWTPPEGED